MDNVRIVKDRLISSLDEVAREARRYQLTSWQLSDGGKDEYRRGQARAASDLEKFVSEVQENAIKALEGID